MGSLAVTALVRLVVLGAALAAYYAAVPYLFPGSEDANIGAGLIAFGALVLISFGWAVIDGRHRGVGPTVATWAVVAVALGVLWFLGMVLRESDGSMSVTERLSVDAFTVVLFAGLVLVPACVGAAAGAAWRRSNS